MRCNLHHNPLPMKHIMIISAACAVLWGCAGGGAPLTQDEVTAFVTNHIESQVGYDAAVEPYKAGLSEEMKYFRAGQGEPMNADLSNVDGEWF